MKEVLTEAFDLLNDLPEGMNINLTWSKKFADIEFVHFQGFQRKPFTIRGADNAIPREYANYHTVAVKDFIPSLKKYLETCKIN